MGEGFLKDHMVFWVMVALQEAVYLIFLNTSSSFIVEQVIGEFSVPKCKEPPPKNKGRANVFRDPDTNRDREKMRTLIETGQYFHDVVENNLICISFASLSRFGIRKNHTTLKIIRYNESLFRASAATLTEKEKRNGGGGGRGGNEHAGEGVGRNEVLYTNNINGKDFRIFGAKNFQQISLYGSGF